MSQTKRKPAIFLMGPTASGKTALAGELFQQLPLELISVDAAQVYQGLNIGTAKPNKQSLKQLPHHLIDIRLPNQAYSASDFCHDAKQLMGIISSNGRIPMLVGGTIFYFNALEFGLSQLPAADKEIRDRLSIQADELGWPAMHAKLATVDPKSAARIEPNDRQRVQRALEIFEITGQAPSEIMASTKESNISEYELIRIAIWPEDRALLHSRIAARFQQMLADGLIDEVSSLVKNKEIDPQCPAMRTVGYAQIRAYLLRQIDYNQMVEQVLAATRQLAKRQLTWLRGYPDVQVFDSNGPNLSIQCIDYLTNRLEAIGAL